MRRIKIVKAVPGAGKTRSITEEISSVLEGGTPVDEIYAVTFTRSAAAELRGRLSQDIHSSTIHSLAYSIVSQYGDPAGKSYSELIDEATRISRLPEFVKDFRCGFLAIDEAQDLTSQQYSFLKSLSDLSSYTYIVGDPNQSIYGFNGSDPEIMMQFDAPDVFREVRSMNTSYRLPSKIASYINLAFYPNADIEMKSQVNGEMMFYGTTKVELYNKAAQTVMKDEEQAVLMRTNREVINFIKRQDVSGKASAVLPSSLHPYISMMYTISRMNEGIYPHELAGLSWMIGGFSWSTNHMLKTMRASRLNREHLDNLFNPSTHLYTDDLPPILPSTRNQVYLLLQEIDEYSKYYSARRKEDISGLLTVLMERAYNTEQFWKTLALTDDDIVNLAFDRIETDQDSYFETNPGANVKCMTMHSSKGREFENVSVVVNGWSVNIYEQEEFRVLYVACSRAKKRLEVISPMDIRRNKDKRNIIDSLNPERDIL